MNRRYRRGWFGESHRHYLAAKGISTSKDYKKWRQLVNMSPAELRNFKNRYGQEAGLSRTEARKEGIRSGRDSAEAILRMRAKSPEQWTDADIEWMKRQNSFVARMKGVEGPLYRDGEPTRKLLALKIWGHDPEKQGKWRGGRGHPYMVKKYDHNEDLREFKERYKNRSVTGEEFRVQSKKALKISVLGIDDGKFKPQELIIPSQKNEAEVAKAIFLGEKLRRQNMDRKRAAKSAEERAKIEAEIRKNDKIRGRLR